MEAVPLGELVGAGAQPAMGCCAWLVWGHILGSVPFSVYFLLLVC